MEHTQTDISYSFSRQQTDNRHAYIRFTSLFNGNTVQWDAHIMTLDWYVENYPENLADTARQFIEISRGKQENEPSLEVALATTKIDHPTILKTIIMIQNYKRLAIGRHEYGEPVPTRSG